MDKKERAYLDAWGIVLAGGSGRRLAPLTTRLYGQAIPKQFAVLCGGHSLLQQTLHRSGSVIPESRTLVVVPREHDELARAQLASFPAAHVMTQPEDRGTGPGLALPLAWIRRRQRDARILVSPSDHFIPDGSPFLTGMRAALDGSRSARLVLLAVHPERAETQYGWIVPGATVGAAVRAVTAFMEKPTQPEADELLRAGALWSTFVFAGAAECLWTEVQRRLPEQCAALEHHVDHVGGATENLNLADLYRTMRAGDFSREVLQVALSIEIPTYAGGLGVLAGDPPRSLADLEVAAVGVSLVHHKGYFRQELRDARQTEHDAAWPPERAAHNGVPSFSVLDGRWREGQVEGATGWSIGGLAVGGDDGADARDLYDKLEHAILPLFYEQREAWVRVMQQSIALNASFFDTHRMVQQYLLHSYVLGDVT